MIKQEKAESQPGFQGSETTTALCTLYHHGDDPIILTGEGDGSELYEGLRADSSVPSVVSVQMHKSIGTPSGQFTLHVKPSKVAESLFDSLVDDDWIDISFGNHGRYWHVFRGMIDEIRVNKSVGGTGATTEVFTLSGRDFAKVWETTPVWFNPYANHDLVAEGISRTIFGGMLEIAKNPGTVVRKFLYDFLHTIAVEEGADWTPPKGMPGIKGYYEKVDDPEDLFGKKYSPSFANSVVFNTGTDFFQNVPARLNFNLTGAVPEGTLWDLAKQYSDPMFTELYADVFPDGDPFSPRIEAGDPLSPKDTRMAVVLRDKPFPLVYSDLPEFESKWDSLPLLDIQRQEIYSTDLGRSGIERFNTFFIAGLMNSESFPEHAVTMLQPLYDRESIKRHGLRRMDIQSSIVPDFQEGELDMTTMYMHMRYLMRDWYCMNPYMYSGTIELAHGRPDIKIGCRVRIPGAALSNNQEQPTETYYVETIDHVWQFGAGMKTILGVTRGWLGTDDSYLDALYKVSQRYELASIVEGMK